MSNARHSMRMLNHNTMPHWFLHFKIALLICLAQMKTFILTDCIETGWKCLMLIVGTRYSIRYASKLQFNNSNWMRCMCAKTTDQTKLTYSFTNQKLFVCRCVLISNASCCSCLCFKCTFVFVVHSNFASLQLNHSFTWFRLILKFIQMD